MNKRTYFLVAFASILVILTIINLVYLKVSINFIESKKKEKADLNRIESVNQIDIIGFRRVNDEKADHHHHNIDYNVTNITNVHDGPINATADTLDKFTTDDIEIQQRRKLDHHSENRKHHKRDHNKKDHHEGKVYKNETNIEETKINITVNINNTQSDKDSNVLNYTNVEGNKTETEATNTTTKERTNETFTESTINITTSTINVTIPQPPYIPSDNTHTDTPGLDKNQPSPHSIPDNLPPLNKNVIADSNLQQKVDPLPNIPAPDTPLTPNTPSTPDTSNTPSTTEEDNWNDEEFHRRDREYHEKHHKKTLESPDIFDGPSDNPLSHRQIDNQLLVLQQTNENLLKLAEINQDTTMEVNQQASLNSTLPLEIPVITNEKLNNTQIISTIPQINQDRFFKEINDGNFKVIVFMISFLMVIAFSIVIYEIYYIQQKEKEDKEVYNYLYEGYQLYRGEKRNNEIVNNNFDYITLGDI